MKFGHVETEELDNLTLKLPPDHTLSKNFEAKKASKKNVYVGCAKWGRAEWVGNLYPEGTKDKDFLSNYVKHFNSIELNSTYYNAKRNNIISWANKANDGFKFCPKFPRRISHLKRLKNVEEMTEYFVNVCSEFKESLGVPFLQMPENFLPTKMEDLNNYLTQIPNDFKLAVELRHKDWFDNESVFSELVDLLSKTNKSLVINDSAGRRDVIHQCLTANYVFIRFNAYFEHPTNEQRMDEWAKKIEEWLNAGVEEIYFFAHQPDESYTPRTADYLVRRINQIVDLNIREPNFLS